MTKKQRKTLQQQYEALQRELDAIERPQQAAEPDTLPEPAPEAIQWANDVLGELRFAALWHKQKAATSVLYDGLKEVVATISASDACSNLLVEWEDIAPEGAEHSRIAVMAAPLRVGAVISVYVGEPLPIVQRGKVVAAPNRTMYAVNGEVLYKYAEAVRALALTAMA